MGNKRKNKIVLSNIDKLVAKLKKSEMPLEEFLNELDSFKDTFYDNPELEFELLLSNGLPIELSGDNIYLKTAKTLLKEQTFCIVDIETNGSDVNKGQIIELGAVKYKAGKVIDKFDSLVYAKQVPRYIQEVTHITPKMLEHAPAIEKVLSDFKIFLQDDVFVAHDIKFDYNFISNSFKKYHLGKLENRKLCTIALAKRTIAAQRYGLDFLKELLHINIDNLHRAYSDALSTTHLLQKSINNLPDTVQTTEDLINFSKSNNIINQGK
ncbi:DNA polymerase III subunit epsilon [Arcobacter sp. CECT 8986]|uniref:3'-5' exonuclease n=1 Tax=Arcobacter sp. CECT 8986 TaxID=2044507 RepID=UPI0010099D46|nr:3'-5' exonuclease [Arcobacter sp. CECT 8986]RXK01251.1 DNA polymerase III subunit epsilon [Arcobacter sp. CECT 8986]